MHIFSTSLGKYRIERGKKEDAFISQILLFPTGASTPGEDTEKVSLISAYLIQREQYKTTACLLHLTLDKRLSNKVVKEPLLAQLPINN